MRKCTYDKKRGGGKEWLDTVKKRLLNTPRGKGTMSSEEISVEIKAYRYGDMPKKKIIESI